MVEQKKDSLKVDLDHISKVRKDPYEVVATPDLLQLYSLSIGIQRDPMNLDDLKFTYERDENF